LPERAAIRQVPLFGGHLEIHLEMGFPVTANALDNRVAREASLARPDSVTARTKDSFVGRAALAREPIMGTFDIQQAPRHVIDLEAADLLAARFGVDPDLYFLPQAIPGIAAVIPLKL
jgi:hypothetical protein